MDNTRKPQTRRLNARRGLDYGAVGSRTARQPHVMANSTLKLVDGNQQGSKNVFLQDIADYNTWYVQNMV